MARKKTFTFRTRGHTKGAVSGNTISWEPGETQVLDPNELEHVADRHYETRPLTPKPSGSAGSGEGSPSEDPTPEAGGDPLNQDDEDDEAEGGSSESDDDPGGAKPEHGDDEAPGGELVPQGSGWYHLRVDGEIITDDDGDPVSVRGKDAARATLNERLR